MHTYPVHLFAARPVRFSRLQLALRMVAFLVLGLLGVGFGLVFVLAYVALPAFACLRLSSHAGRYFDEDAPRVLRVLRWLAAISGWAGLIAEHLPSSAPDERIIVVIDGRPHATAGSALLRVLTGIPSALVLVLLFMVGAFVWIWSALSVLFVERVGPRAFGFLVGLQRWTVRLLAYQASLVDPYPPFSFADDRNAMPEPHHER